jgi:hypothetical protein
MKNKSSLRRLHPNIWIVTLTSFLTDVSSEMIVYLVPLFLSNVLGVRTAIIGLIDGIAETTASLLKIYSGALSDKLGKRKWLAVLGYGLSTLAKPFLYFANTWGWVMGVRFVDRAGKGIRTAPRDALVASSTGEDQRGLAFGLHRAGDTAGAFLGIGIAGLIIWLTQAGSVQITRLTFQTAVLVSIIPAVLAVLVLAVGAKDLTGTGKGSGTMRLSLQGMDARFKTFLFIVVLFTLGNSSDSFIDDIHSHLHPALRSAWCPLGSGRPAESDHWRVAGLWSGVSRLCPGANRLAGMGAVRVVRGVLRGDRGGGQGTCG